MNDLKYSAFARLRRIRVADPYCGSRFVLRETDTQSAKGGLVRLRRIAPQFLLTKHKERSFLYEPAPF
jgi:hypothetical protein